MKNFVILTGVVLLLTGCADSSRNLNVDITVEQGATLTLGDITPEVYKEGGTESPTFELKDPALDLSLP